MAQPSTVQGDMRVSGNFSAGSMSLPANSVGDSNVAAGSPGHFMQYNKLQQMHRQHHSQPNTAATTETRTLYTVFGANATMLDFRCGSIAVAIGGATVVVDLLKNGVSALNSTITLNSSSVANVQQVGSLKSSALTCVTGDVFEIVITATASGGTLPTGFNADFSIAEDPF